MVFGTPVSGASSGFKDVHSTMKSYEAITTLYKNKVIDGYGDGTYRPSAKLTRGQAAKMIAGALKLDTTHVSDPKFKDVPTSHSFYPYIAVLKSEGIIDGYPDGRFGVNDPLNRGQMAKILSLAYGLEEKPLQNSQFTDVNAGAFYSVYLQHLIDLKITTGTTKTTFSPAQHVDRGQMAIFIFRSEQAKGTVGPSPKPEEPKPEPAPNPTPVNPQEAAAAVEVINAASVSGNWNSVSVEDFNKIGLNYTVTADNVDTIRTYLLSYQRIEIVPVTWTIEELIKAVDSNKRISFVQRSPKLTDISPKPDGAGVFHSQFKWGSLDGTRPSDSVTLAFSARKGSTTQAWKDKIESFELKSNGTTIKLDSANRTPLTVFNIDEIKNMELTVKFKDGVEPAVHYIDIDVLKGDTLIDQIQFTYDFRELD